MGFFVVGVFLFCGSVLGMDGIVLDQASLVIVDRLWRDWLLRVGSPSLPVAEVLFAEACEHRGVAELYEDDPRLELANRKIIFLLDLFPELEPEPEPELHEELEPGEELEPDEGLDGVAGDGDELPGDELPGDELPGDELPGDELPGG